MVYLNRCVLLAVLGLLAACSAEPKSTFSLVEATISDVQNAVRSGNIAIEGQGNNAITAGQPDSGANAKQRQMR